MREKSFNSNTDLPFSTFLNVSISAKWSLMNHISIHDSPDELIAFDLIKKESCEFINCDFLNCDFDHLTMLYLWMINRMKIESLSSLLPLLTLLRSTLLPAIFNPVRPISHRQRFLVTVAGMFHHLMLELGTAAIGSRVPILKQLTETIVGNSQIIAVDLQSSEPQILHSIQSLLLVGHKVVGLARSITSKKLLGMNFIHVVVMYCHACLSFPFFGNFMQYHS